MADACDGDVCPTCDKPYADEEAREMTVSDPRAKEWCWTDLYGPGDECDGTGEIKRAKEVP